MWKMTMMRIKAMTFEVGDAVLVDISRRLVGNKKSLTPKWVGPFEVVDIVTRDDEDSDVEDGDDESKGDQYVLREIGNEQNEKKENVHSLKKYHLAPFVELLVDCRRVGNERMRSIEQYVFEQCTEYRMG